MQQKTASEIAQMGIMQLLAAVFTGQVPESPGSSMKHEGKEKQHGTITLPVTRNLFSAKYAVGDYMEEIVKEHNRLHKEGPAPTAAECNAFKDRLLRLEGRKQLLHGLLWQSINEEHPQVAANDNVAIRNGWDLFSEDGEWKDIVPYGDKSGLAYTFIARIAAIVSGECPSVKDENLDPVAEAEEVVGVIEDARVRALRSLGDDIRVDFTKQFPLGFGDDIGKGIGELTLNQVAGMTVLMRVIRNLSEIGSALFWCAVRDTVTAATELPHIAIREGWKVVKCPPDKDDDSVQLLMTPFGTAISMKMSLSIELLESLLRK